MHVIIMSGISGAGKSTYVDKRRNDYDAVRIVSADDFFWNHRGEWVFVPHLLAIAHGTCLRQFTSYVINDRTGVLFVDNTNLTPEEIAPYYALATAYGHTVELVTVHCGFGKAAARSLHNNSPVAAYESVERLRLRKLPAYWDIKVTNI